MSTLQDVRVKLKELKEEKTRWEKELKNYFTIKHTISGLDEEIKTLEKQIKQRKDAEMLKEIAELETDELTPDEKTIIVNNMDKTDYRQYDATLKRWIDVDKIIKEVTEIKKQYPGWTLKDMRLGMRLDRFPPRNVYHYKYATPWGHIVSLSSEMI
jgi:DNA repair exonuclease SbcCD ATPase subunit